MRINRKVYNYIDYELSNYKSYEKKIEAIKQEIISSSPPLQMDNQKEMVKQIQH